MEKKNIANGNIFVTIAQKEVKMSVKDKFNQAVQKVKKRRQERRDRRLDALEDSLIGDIAAMIRMIFGNPGSRSLR